MGRPGVSVLDIAARVRTVDPDAELIAAPESVGARSGDGEIRDLTHDSRQVIPGAVFAAVPGAVHDGHDHVGDAVEAGATAIIVERQLSTAVPQVVTSSVRAALGPASALVHGDPSARLRLVGITGTNGKTTTSWLLDAMFHAAGLASELIGTITGTRTTPEATDLQRRLGRHAADGIDAVAMEVSSHALALHRVDGCSFAVGVFTNLSPDHLDFHGSMEDYGAAKARLFDPARTAVAVIDVDDDFGRDLADRLPRHGSIEVRRVSVADAADVVSDAHGTSFVWRGQPMRVHLPGRFNLSNAIAAATAADVLGLSREHVAAGLDAARSVPGRMEPVDAGQDFGVIVDYAHTPDAVGRALAALRSVLEDGSRLIAVMGCGGERDVAKRPAMGAELAEGADIAVITSDNPRSEDPAQIIDDILSGVPGWQDRGDLIVEADRATAIARALDAAGPGDIVLIAGKGHETYQDIGGERLDFDDREVARSLLDARAGDNP